MYVLLTHAGQYYVDGVGYATIQAILSGGLIVPGLLALLFFAKLCATSVSLGSGASGGIFSPSLFMGATIGGAFGAAISAIHPVDGLGVTTCAMIGMAAMVGGGTGAAMTAVTMIFEMTRDYDLVMPIIVAVALAIGVRRLLSQENIYTVKLVGRKHFVPKALHANMFLVRRAGEVMERDVTLLPKDTRLETFLRQRGHEGRMKHIVVTDGDRIVGVLRVNTALRRGLEDVEQGFTRRRDRAAQLHGGARGGHRIRRGHAHDAAQCRHGGGDQGQGPPARRRRARRHHQGAHRRLGRRQHQALRVGRLNSRPLPFPVKRGMSLSGTLAAFAMPDHFGRLNKISGHGNGCNTFATSGCKSLTNR